MAQQVTTSTGAPGGAAQPAVFPPLDPSTFPSQLVWLALSFGALYVILSRVALPRIGEVIEERRERIERDIAGAEQLKAETEKAIADYEQAMAEARASAGAIARQTRADLAAETDAERAKVERQIADQLAGAERQIADTKSRAMASVGEIAAETAGAIVDKLVGVAVGKDDLNRALAQRAAE